MTRNASGLRQIGIYVALFAGAIIFAGPMLWVLKSSITPLEDIFTYPPQLLPSRVTLDNYQALFDAVPVFRIMFNSLVVAVLYTTCSVALSSLVGFGFAKYQEAPGARILFIIMLASIMVPFQTFALSLFVQVSRIGWSNSYLGLVLPLMANGFSGFMMTQFMRGMPREILDAARIDGCNDFRAFLYVVLPVMRPALGALAVFNFVYSWNNFFWPLLVLSREEMYTVPVVLGSFIVQQAVVPYHIIVAAITLAMVPIIIVFTLSQRQFIEGLTMGAFK